MKTHSASEYTMAANDAARCEDGLGQAWGHAAPVAEKSGDPGERTLQAADELVARRSGQIVPRRNQQVSHPLDREHEEDSSSWHQQVLRGGQQYEQRRRTQEGERRAGSGSQKCDASDHVGRGERVRHEAD